MSRKTNITQDLAGQTTATSETGSALSSQAQILGSGNRLTSYQITTDAGIIAAAAAAGQKLLETQNRSQLASLESTKQISDKILERAATTATGKTPEEIAAASDFRRNLIFGGIAAAAVLAYLLKK